MWNILDYKRYSLQNNYQLSTFLFLKFRAEDYFWVPEVFKCQFHYHSSSRIAWISRLVSSSNWISVTEFVGETVHDSQWLHDKTYSSPSSSECIETAALELGALSGYRVQAHSHFFPWLYDLRRGINAHHYSPKLQPHRKIHFIELFVRNGIDEDKKIS